MEELLDKNLQLAKEIEQLKRGQVKQLKNEIAAKIVNLEGVHFVSDILNLDGGSIKDLCFQLKADTSSFFGVFGGKADDKATLTIVISDDLAKEKSLHAGNMVREASKLIQGGGGGQPFFATAGGKDASGLTAAIDKVKELSGLF